MGGTLTRFTSALVPRRSAAQVEETCAPVAHTRKRCREGDMCSGCITQSTVQQVTTASDRAALTHVFEAPLGIRSARSNDECQRLFGAHYQLYPTDSPSESHSSFLAWNCSRQALSILGAARLCRVANSCRKATLFLFYVDDVSEGNDGAMCAVALRYASSI